MTRHLPFRTPLLTVAGTAGGIIVATPFTWASDDPAVNFGLWIIGAAIGTFGGWTLSIQNPPNTNLPH